MTREDVAEIIGAVPRHIQTIENEGRVPSVELLVQLATMFDISVDEYIFPDRKAVKGSMRRQVDRLLDDLSDKDLCVVEGTAMGIHKAEKLPE